MLNPNVLADGRWVGRHGIGRFASEVLRRMPEVTVLRGGISPLHPLEPVWLSLVLARRRPAVYFNPGFTVPLWSDVPLVFTIHDLIHLQIPQEGSVSKHLYYRLIIKPAAYRAFRVLTVSEFSRRDILEWTGLPPERVTVASPGVSDAFRPTGRIHDAGRPYLLYVGNRKPHKNLASALRAFARAKLGSNMALVLTGDPDPVTVAAARALSLEGRVIFAGPLSDEDLATYYRGALMLLIPSLYEGFGLPALEAMACGTPVAGAVTTSLIEVVGSAGLLVNPVDADALTVAMESLVSDSRLRAVLRDRGLERAARFTWERTAQIVRNVLASALGAEPDRAGHD